MAAVADGTRCPHDLAAGQCSVCVGVAATRRGRVDDMLAGKPTERVRRLAAAMRAEERGRAGTKAERKALRAAVERAGAGLSKGERRLARKLATAPADRARAAREQRIREDKIAGIHTPWITTQNVGRGRRS